MRRAEREAQRTRRRAAAIARQLERTRARRPWLVARWLLSGLLGLSTWFYVTSRASARQLALQVRVAETVNRFMVEDLIGASGPAVRGRSDVTLLDAARGAAPEIDTVFGSEAPAHPRRAARRDAGGALRSQRCAAARSWKATRRCGRYAESPRRGSRECAVRVRVRLASDLARVGTSRGRHAARRRRARTAGGSVSARGDAQVEYLMARATLACEPTRSGPRAGVRTARRGRCCRYSPTAGDDLRDRLQFAMANSLWMAGNVRAASR
jgi:eukaryotic-like serine/threonine-protein kinase